MFRYIIITYEDGELLSNCFEVLLICIWGREKLEVKSTVR